MDARGDQETDVHFFGDKRRLTSVIEQRLCLFEIRRVKTLGEPAVDRREKIAALRVTTLATAEPGEDRHPALERHAVSVAPGAGRH
jgi:hypothetical protein